MKLIYRGLKYDRHLHKPYSHPFQLVVRSGAAYNLTYRGVTYRVEPNAKPVKVPEKTVTYKLIYRGVSYLVNRTIFAYKSIRDDSRSHQQNSSPPLNKFFSFSR